MRISVKKGFLAVLTASVTAILITACGTELAAKDEAVPVSTTVPEEQPIGMPNPASVYCEQQGGTLEMREGDGGTAGYCHLPDGTVIEEWAFWRQNNPQSGGIVPTPGSPPVRDGTPVPLRQYTVEESLEIAKHFVLNCPTYTFDGIEGSLEIGSTTTLRCPSCWQFTLRFESSAAGFGDRAGQMLAQVITPHEAVITVARGNVVGAVMDGEWDMQTQTLVGEADDAQGEAEQLAREYALNTPTFRFDGIEGTLELVETLNAFCAGCWGFKFQFDSRHAGYGDRTGQMLAQVITRHEILVSINNGRIDGATIDGKWDVVSQAPIKPPVVVTAVVEVPAVPVEIPDLLLSEEGSVKAAWGFIRESKTFEFDGIEDTLKLVETHAPSGTTAWLLVFTFDSSQSGYGNREGQMLAQVITPHRAEITVDKGEVVRAVLDGRWDMIQQDLIR